MMPSDCHLMPWLSMPCSRVLKQVPGAMYTFYQNGTFQKRKAHPENANYQVILPIRAMLLKKLDLKKYKALTALQSHLEEREEMGKTQVVKDTIIPVVQQYKLQVQRIGLTVQVIHS